jgi:hypothetical protein
MAGDRHLQCSTGVRDENYDNKHRIHISERVTRVSISVYLDIVQAIRQHDVQVHPLSTVSKTHPYRLCEYDTATGEYACILYREDALNFIHSCNVRGSGTQEDFILWFVDSGTTSFLSDLLRHMFAFTVSMYTTLITPNKHKVPLIRDDVINFTWLTERPRASPTILMQQKVARDFDRAPESKVRRPVKIPVLENVDPTPVRPDNKENIDTILDARTKLQRLNFGGAGIHSNVEADGESRKSPRLAAKQIDTTPAMRTGKWHVIDRIVEHRDIEGQKEYKVRWKGYGANEDQWKEAEDIRDEIREEYEKSVKQEKTIGPCTLRIDCRCKEC